MFVAWLTSTETMKSTVKGVWEGLKARRWPFDQAWDVPILTGTMNVWRTAVEEQGKRRGPPDQKRRKACSRRSRKTPARCSVMRSMSYKVSIRKLALRPTKGLMPRAIWRRTGSPMYNRVTHMGAPVELTTQSALT
jgi:hypothetical protein